MTPVQNKHQGMTNMRSEDEGRVRHVGFNELAVKYTKLHQQGWLPILVNDRLDAVQLAEISVDAGCKVIEITCRRENIAAEIRLIKRRFPELLVLAGSVVDDGPLLQYVQQRRPGFPSIQQLAELGTDGFVAMLPFSQQTLQRYAQRHIMIPGVETLGEAVAALNAGAHFAKFCLSPPERIRHLTSAPTHQLIPVFFTGGVRLETVRDYIEAGAELLGGGWDLMLGQRYNEMQERPDPQWMRGQLERFQQAVCEARAVCRPQEAAATGENASDPGYYLQQLKHYHPF